jgi:hypothetical protein
MLERQPTTHSGVSVKSGKAFDVAICTDNDCDFDDPKCGMRHALDKEHRVINLHIVITDIVPGAH